MPPFYLFLGGVLVRDDPGIPTEEVGRGQVHVERPEERRRHQPPTVPSWTDTGHTKHGC